MRFLIVSRAIGAIGMISAMLAVSPAHAHEGHDLAPLTATAADPNLVVRSASNDDYEVVLKYRASAGAAATNAVLYVSDYATNAPIDRAHIAFRTTTPAQIAAVAVQNRPGIYEVDLPATKAGDYAAIVTIAGPRSSELVFQNLPLGKAVELASADPVPKREHTGPAAWPWLVLLLPAIGAAWLIVRRGRAHKRYHVGAAVLLVAVGGLTLQGQSQGHEGHGLPPTTATAGGAGPRYVSKESQFLLNVRTMVVRNEALHDQITAIGHVVPGAGGLATVAAPQTGKFEREGRPLAIGDRVREGQLLGYLLVIDRIPVRAPISGLLSNVSVTSGQWVQAGEALAQVLNETKARVEVPLFGDDLTKALASQDVSVRLGAMPNRYFSARVRGLAPTSSAPEQPGEGSQQPTASPIPPVLMEVTNAGGFLRPGMLVEVAIQGAASRQGVALPQSAVVYQESGPGVFVHTAPEVFEYRPIGITGRQPGRVEISGVIKPGERVVTGGAYTLVSAPPVGAATGAKP